MSASRERKKRTEQVAQPAKEKKSKKLSQGWIFAICMIAIVVILVGALIGYTVYKNNRAVLTVGDHTVTVPEFNFFYNTKTNSCKAYASYLGIDPNTPLDEQYVTESGAGMLMVIGLDSDYLADKTATDGTYNVTWAQLFAAAAKKDATSAYAVYNEAMANGYQLTEHDKEDIDSNIEQMEAYAESNGMSLNRFIENVYGKGCSESSYRNYLEVQVVASGYASTLTYSAEELAAKKAETPETYEIATYYQFVVSASDFVVADEDGQKAEPTDAEVEQAKAAAEAMEDKFDTENSSVTLKADAGRATVTATSTEEAANWLFDTADSGASKLFEKENTYYVLKLVDKNDYKTGNYLQIVIPDDVEGVETEDQMTAAEKIEAIKAALDADATEENFKALAEEYSASHESEAKNLSRSSLASVSNEAVLWSMEARTAGDYKIFELDGNTVILFYVSEGETYTDVVATAALANAHIEEIGAAAEEACNYDEKAAMAANVGIVFGSN